ncbi:hypothetical protein DFQ30_008142 [Apophysomyces sp. BC1015]|nr:hypothetical protein DFQ30_008142 [Apophysomyces sp. BC1015]
MNDFFHPDDFGLQGLSSDTLAVRAGTRRTLFNEHSEALLLTSSFCFDSAAQAAERFADAENSFTYSRFTNPTVSMLQDRLAALEGGEACIATASGMSAILSIALSVLQSGDHIVSSRSLFGSTFGMFAQMLPRFGITTTFVDPSDLDAWRCAVKPATRMFFLETPSNPLTEVSDIDAVSRISKQAGALFVVDNCFCSPALQQPLKLGADVVMHSATKYLDGQGRVLGGALVGERQLLMDKVFPFVRSAGPTLSAFNAALELARWLEAHPAVSRVFHPGLESHPQYALAKRQQRAGGAIVSFELKGESPQWMRENAWRVIDGTRICSITGNLGDTRTTLTHPATTTHARITPEARAAAGITEGLIRMSVGLEGVDDLKRDLERGLSG